MLCCIANIACFFFFGRENRPVMRGFCEIVERGRNGHLEYDYFCYFWSCLRRTRGESIGDLQSQKARQRRLYQAF